MGSGDKIGLTKEGCTDPEEKKNSKERRVQLCSAARGEDWATAASKLINLRMRDMGTFKRRKGEKRGEGESGNGDMGGVKLRTNRGTITGNGEAGMDRGGNILIEKDSGGNPQSGFEKEKLSLTTFKRTRGLSKERSLRGLKASCGIGRGIVRKGDWCVFLKKKKKI